MRTPLHVVRCATVLSGVLLVGLLGAAAASAAPMSTAPMSAAPMSALPTAATADPAITHPLGGQRLAGPGTVAGTTTPALPTVAAASWLVADLDTGEVLAAKDPHGRFAPASTLKTLTAVTLIPLLEPDRKLVPTFEDVNVDGSKVGVVERVGYPASELIRAMLMVSGNDAANVLATAVGGQEATARLMNAKAAELGALDTHAVNPHGLDAPGQVSSAYDLAVIGRAGLADPTFASDVATLSSSISAPGSARIQTRNHDKLLGSYPGALGIKNGYTTAARASFVGAASRDGHRIIVTLMRAEPRVFAEAIKLLDWGFAALASSDLSPVGELPGLAGAQALPGPPAQLVTGRLGPEVSSADRPPAVSAVAGLATSSSVAPSADETPLLAVLAGLALAAAALAYARPASPGSGGGARLPRNAPVRARPVPELRRPAPMAADHTRAQRRTG